MEKKLAQLANTESWKLVVELLNDVADSYYSWENTKSLKEAKGVQTYKNIIIRKVEGAKDELGK